MYVITDELVTASTGLRPDAIRKLVDCGFFAPADADQRAKGRTRKWGDETVGNAARVAALRNAGLSLFQAAALLAIGDDYVWRKGTKFPSMISPRGEGVEAAKSELGDFLKIKATDLRALDDDLLLHIIDGRFVFERRGKKATRHLIAELVDERVLTSSQRRTRVPREMKLPIDDDRPLATKEAKPRELQPVAETTVNLDLCARIAIRELYEQAGFAP